MSDLTDALSSALHSDLEGLFDAYQQTLLGNGEPAWPDATPLQFAGVALANSLFKKYNDRDEPSEEAQTRAMAKFMECNEANAAYSFAPNFTSDEEMVNDVALELHKFYYPSDSCIVGSLYDLYDRGSVGRGSTRGARDVDFYTKMWDSHLSFVDPGLMSTYMRMVDYDPRTLKAEANRRRFFGFRQVSGNKLSFVNKTAAIARGICTEPTINCWFQLGLGAILTDRLKSRYDVSLDVQPDVNRAMARRGSIDGSFSTVDLESASDLMSIKMCERILPKDLLAYMKLVRSPVTTLPDKRVVELHSISTMGNGFTFPLMTAIFCAVIKVVYGRLGLPFVFGNSSVRTFSVFGDDIIVKREAYGLLVRLLNLLGFRVNDKKSFVEGPFRESCGADFYLGNPVRGVYIKRLRTPQDFAVAINRLNEWSAAVGIPLPTAVGLLSRVARKLCGKPLLLVPMHCSADAGVRVPLAMVRSTVVKDRGLMLYSSWVPRCSGIQVVGNDEGYGVGLKVPRWSVPRNYNPDGFWLCGLLGVLRGHRIVIQSRRRETRYGVKRAATPSWDAAPPLGLGDPLYWATDRWRRLADAVRRNFTPS